MQRFDRAEESHDAPIHVRRRLLRASVAWFLLTIGPVAHADGIRIVREADDQVFSDFQSAVNAAEDGDVLIAGEGRYDGFLVSRKGVSIVAAPGALVEIDGTVRISGTTPEQRVVISGLRVETTSGQPLICTDLAGPTFLQDCQVVGSTVNDEGADALRATDCGQLTLINCTLQAGHAPEFDEGDGGRALNLTRSSVAVYDSQSHGGDGGSSSGCGGFGGDACNLNDSFLFASGSSFLGGNGGEGAQIGGDGGDGICVSVFSQAYLFDVGAAGGWGAPGDLPGCDGCGVCGRGLINWIPGDARTFEVARVAADNANLTVQVRGVPGDRAYALLATEPAFAYVAMFHGVWLIPAPPWLDVIALGVVGASGTAQLSLPLADLAPRDAVQRVWFQGLARDTQGETFLGTPRSIAILNWDSNPDCNGNLIQDYAEVIEGVATDANTNIKPDDCEPQGGIWYVDWLALPGGDGSQQKPFVSIGEGIAHATEGHEVWVADGYYAGSANRNMAIRNDDIVVRSMSGPENCVIDVEYADRAFYLSGGLSPATRVEGFTIRRGLGGIYVDSCDPTIASCRFEDCTSDAWNPLWLDGSSSLVTDCVFLRNRSRLGGAIRVEDGVLRLRSCWFEDNSSAFGGAAFVRASTPTAEASVVSHCTFLGNRATHAGGDGGAMDIAVPGSVIIAESLFAWNRSPRHGGALALTAEANIADCTFIANSAVQQGGAIRMLFGSQTALTNSILWANTAAQGQQVSITGALLFTISYCDLEGGQSGVHVTSGGTVNWGAGNLAEDPNFADPDGPDNDPMTWFDNDYRLGPMSPCIDAADSSAIPADLLDIDGDGNTSERIELDLDLGPRLVDDPDVGNTGAGAPPYADMGPYERNP